MQIRDSGKHLDASITQFQHFTRLYHFAWKVTAILIGQGVWAVQVPQCEVRLLAFFNTTKRFRTQRLGCMFGYAKQCLLWG